MPDLASTVAIRTASMAEAPAMLALYRALQAYHEQAVPHLSEIDPGPKTLAEIDALLNKQGTLCYIALSQENVIAMLAGRIEPSNSPFLQPHLIFCIHSVIVAASARGQGIGRQLIERAIEQAKAKGAQAVELSVFAFNQPAQALYESMGFESWITRLRQKL
ncbi:GNAT family N-acetyltransferase [Chitinivorax sp. B]|uniref:GNAT family N-acetyltransferase n=1 Tax=Chitinivorax sp. B TaxID=2502235 RepID=UPI0010F44146|nr:GNAT family N-acetyltransferase [Chitinivorax sp. B]